MAISFSIRLQDTAGAAVPIVDYRVPQHIVLAAEADSWPRAYVIGLTAADPITAELLRQFFRRQGSEDFHFKAMLAGGRLRFASDPRFEDVPAGSYRLRVFIEDLKLEPGSSAIAIRPGFEDTAVATVLADPRSIRLVQRFDPLIERLLWASTLEGEGALAWLADARIRASRRACVQNILAKLRCAPSVDDPLLPLVNQIFLAAPDRIYAGVDRALYTRLQALADGQEWSYEGPPQSDVHARLLDQARERGLAPNAGAYTLESFRQDTEPSVQIVVAVPPAGGTDYFADIDIDLGNPFMDLRGAVVHAIEVAGGEVTDHLSMRARLAGDPDVAPFLAYAVESECV